MIVGVLDHQVGRGFPRARDDSLVHRCIPADFRRHLEAQSAQLGRVAFHHGLVSPQKFLAKHPQAVGREEARVCERGLVVADEKLD